MRVDTSFIWDRLLQYGGYMLHTGGGSDNEPHVCLHLGLTDYRSILSLSLRISLNSLYLLA